MHLCFHLPVSRHMNQKHMTLDLMSAFCLIGGNEAKQLACTLRT